MPTGAGSARMCMRIQCRQSRGEALKIDGDARVGARDFCFRTQSIKQPSATRGQRVCEHALRGSLQYSVRREAFMSSPVDRAQGADDLSLYAPKRAAGTARRGDTLIDTSNLDEPDGQQADASAIEEMPASLDPTMVPQPSAAGPRVSMAGRLVLAAAGAAVLALLVVAQLPGWSV